MSPLNIFGELKVFLLNPRFLHVLFTWGQAWGFFFGILLLILGKWAYKDARTARLGIIILACLGVLTYGIDRNSQVAKTDLLTSPSPQLRRDQENRRKDTTIFYYVYTAICLMHLVGRFEKDAEKWFFLTLFVGGIFFLVLSFWHQLKESQLVYSL